MSETEKFEKRFHALEKVCTALEAKTDMLLQKLDEARRACRLSPIIDEQLIALNRRVQTDVHFPSVKRQPFPSPVENTKPAA